jgi:hypothetical protein
MAGATWGSIRVTLSAAKGTISSMAPFAPLRVTSWYAPESGFEAAA